MKTSASFRLASRPSNASLQSRRRSTTSNSGTCLTRNTLSSASSGSTRDDYHPIGSSFLRKPLQDFDSPTKNVSYKQTFLGVVISEAALGR